MLDSLLSALALVLVIEGILPFVCPECWRSTMRKLVDQQPRALRIIGLISMLLGVLLLYLVHN
jgi:uncharacterized protein YjeT (DUF2065 family)